MSAMQFGNAGNNRQAEASSYALQIARNYQSNHPNVTTPTSIFSLAVDTANLLPRLLSTSVTAWAAKSVPTGRPHR